MDKLSSSVKNKKTTLKIKGALALWLLISSPPAPGEEGLPVAFITDLLAALGEHLPLLLVGCAEILLAVYLIGKLLWGKVQHKPTGKGRGAEAIFLQEWKRQSEEVCILLRRRDRMPVYTVGNLREVLGVTLTRLREDAASLLAGLDDETERKQRWKTYLDWDGAKPLVAEAAMQNGRWVRFIAHRSQNDNYDLIFGRDITREHQRLEDDKTKLMQVEEASQSKTTFLSRMSHEIRTPMNGIIGMLALAEGKMQKQDPAMQYLDKANELSAHLLSLINDILDMSRIEAGKVELENKPFSLRAMGDKLYDMFAKTLDARGIRYAVNFEGVTVDWLLGDELRLSQIMINFLSNAVKFTEQGEIVVTIRQMMLREGNVDLLLRVHDTGQGMDPNFVYRALRQVRDTLNETVTYTKAPQAAPEGEDPILWFLTQSRQGNDVLYASAAVQALRAHGIPARYAEGYYLSASDAANSPDGTVTLTGQNAHAWVEVYFDGVGWLPTDVTPGYYYDTVALQQMVGTPDTVRKTAALEDDQTGAEGVTGEDNGGSEENITPQEAVKNGAIALAGLVGLCLLLACIVLLVLELMRAAVLWRLTQRFRAADAAAQITMLEGQIFTFLDLWGYEASLGWHTEELDAALAKKFTAIEPGEFRRVSRLMEQAVYGGLELEEYETRAIRSFLSKISLVKPGDGWKIRRRLRYGWLPIFAKRIHKRKK